jgi:hypothetical protein
MDARLTMPRREGKSPAQIIAEFRDGTLTEADAVKAIKNYLKKPGCQCCGVMEKEYMRMVDERNNAIEMCADVADKWEPPMPPAFNSVALTAEFDQFDAKIRPIQIAAAKAVSKAIREKAT